jgi:hypothetical protein
MSRFTRPQHVRDERGVSDNDATWPDAASVWERAVASKFANGVNRKPDLGRKPIAAPATHPVANLLLSNEGAVAA